MQCLHCRNENPPQAKFCSQCGDRLAATCAHCATELPPEAKYCLHCGQAVSARVLPSRFSSPETYTPKHLAEKILNSKNSLAGERKQVTVLFVDVSGFTSISERLDPEDVHSLMSRALDLMLSEVHRYEGTVTQFLGDGIMALFGAPIAHEDHAQRAIHAALGIRAVLAPYKEELRLQRGLSFDVRQGINTGLVVVGSIGSDLRMDYTAIGDSTNVAARLQQVSDPGRITISEVTYRLAGGYFHTRPLGELFLKGKSGSMQAWDVISARMARTRLDVEAERGLTPFVGRERELKLLWECFERAKAGHGQVAFVSGEPGVGKSRLLLEFRRRIGNEATWLEGRTMSFGRSIAFHPLIDLLKRNFRIEEGDREETIIKKIDGSVLRLGEDLRSILPYLRYLLSVDPGEESVLKMDAQLRRGEIFDALRRLSVRAAEVHPQVIVYEDVHWMDQASEESLVFAADSIPNSRTLQILTYRTGYVQPLGERTYHTRIMLDSLSAEDSVEMTKGLLAAEQLPDELSTLIARKAEGNPFFVEEVVKSLQESGAIRRAGHRYVFTKSLDEIFIPDRIQDVIMARIDRLADAPKKTLQLASVIGREFTRRLVDRLAEIRESTEDFLRELKAIELIYEKGLFPELSYMFKHALTHEVAYNSLLLQRRRELHRLIGLAIEDLYASRLAEQYEVIAYHFSKAEEWTKALDYLLKAADKAAKAFAVREAINLYDQAEDVVGKLGDAADVQSLMAIHQAKMNLYFILSNFEGSRGEGERYLASARRVGDRVGEGAALVGMGRAALWEHDFDRALEYSRQAIGVASAAGAKPVLAGGHVVTGVVYLVTSRLQDGSQELQRALTVSREADDVLNESLALCFIGLAANWAGNFDRASQIFSDAMGIARRNNLLMPRVMGLFMHGIALTGRGDYDEALQIFEEGLALSEKVGDEVNCHRLLNSQGWLYSEIGDLDRAIDLNRRGAEGARRRGDPETIANPEVNLGDIFLLKGDLVLAQEFLEGVYKLAKNPATSDWMRWRYSTHLFASLGDLWLARGDFAKALEFCSHCLDLAARTDSKKNLVKGWRLKGEIARARRQWDEAETALAQALAMAQAIGNPTQLWKSHVARGLLDSDRKRPDAAEQAFAAARSVLDRVKGSLHHPLLRTALENAPTIQKIYALSAR